MIGLLAVSTSAITEHRLPGFMAAVLPLVALGAFEVVAPAADAVARMADHREAAARLVAVADLAVPVEDPADSGAPPRRVRGGPRGCRAPLHDRRAAGAGRTLAVGARRPSPRRGRAQRCGQEQHRQRAAAVLGSGVRRRPARRDRARRAGPGCRPRPHRLGRPGRTPLPHHHRRQHRRGPPGRHPGGDRRRGAAGPARTVDRRAARRHGHPRGRAGRPTVRRPAATGGSGPCPPGRRTGTRARRADRRAWTAPRHDASSTTW